MSIYTKKSYKYKLISHDIYISNNNIYNIKEPNFLTLVLVWPIIRPMRRLPLTQHPIAFLFPSTRVSYLFILARTDHRSVGWVPCAGTYSSGFKSSTWHGYSYFTGFISGFNGAMLSVVDDVPVDNEAPVVTS